MYDMHTCQPTDEVRHFLWLVHNYFIDNVIKAIVMHLLT